MATTKKATTTKKTPAKKTVKKTTTTKKTAPKKVAPKKTVTKKVEETKEEVTIKTGKFCEYCGKNISEKAEVCPSCGQYTSLHKEKVEKSTTITDSKVFNILSYFGPLWIIGMLCDKKDDKDVRFHVGQGMLVTIVEIAVALINNLIIANIFVRKIDYWYYTYKTTSGFGLFLMWVLWMIPAVLSVIGIINAYKGKQKELPYIGKYSFYNKK